MASESVRDQLPRPGAARGSPASLGSSQELFGGSGSRCAAAVGFLLTAVGGYAALASLWCYSSAFLSVLLHSSPSCPFVELSCLRGEAGHAPGALSVEVGAQHLFSFMFGCFQCFNTALGI